ncbi:MAG: sigma-70 family RNA polymerase sigma factor [Planctomycetes bacterium]|nr:sigma-70 family RNA polymerase sigma factor [Planctomycetota bacterium]
MPDLPDTNHSLIARVKDLADGASWGEFLAIYQPVVLRMARRRGLQDADAQDVMQQIFLSISRSIEGWTAERDQPPFRAWLTTIARNAITKALTRRRRDVGTGSTSVAELLKHQPEHDNLTADLLVEARRELVRWAAEQIRLEFSDETWKVFWMTSIDGTSVAETVKITGRSSGSIYVARYRVIARLKEKILEVSQLWDLQEPKP